MRTAALPPARALALALALALAAAPALGDRQSAQFFSGRAEKALQAKDFPGAEENYRRALVEDAGFLPARYGLAQALLGLGKPEPALEELHAFVEAVKGDPASPPEWKALQAKAEKQFADLDASAAELQRIVDRYADDLVALARKWAGRDPETSEKAARRALLLRPSDRAAAEILSKVDAAPKGPPVALFNGADLKTWVDADFPYWQVVEGNVIADVRDGSRQIRTQAPVEGDFDIRMDARFLEQRAGQDAMIGLLAGYRGNNDFLGIGLINGKVYFWDRLSEKDKKIFVKVPIAEWKAPFDPAQWNTYELRLRGDEVTALINGEVVGREVRTEARKGGFAALYAQAAKVAFRKVELQRR